MFHPLISRWFSETLGTPTPAQLRGWAAIRQGRHTLIAAPTGSGKTLAAFLSAIDDLLQEGLRQPLPDETRVVYVSPLKALSADIHKNLAEPRRAIRRLAEDAGLAAPRITTAVRTGDTTASERAAMLRKPPHILVTTPESLYLLLTAERSRDMLRTVRTVIVDEIHAVIGTRRGAHLALSLERLEELCSGPAAFDLAQAREAGPQPEGLRRGGPSGPPLLERWPGLQRIGLSATQKPVEEVARFLVGADPRRIEAVIVDEGHRRHIDLAVEIPRSPLDAVMSHEVWEEYYDRLTELVEAHRTTLVFVNTRTMAERVARHLSERLGDDAVTAHHGSLSKEHRLDAEHRLKTGALKALVATASLELGIDVGHVDLVCQIGSPHRIATLLQRVGRSGHTIGATPKGRLLPVSRDDLVECAALLRSVRRGELDAIVTHDAPLDVLAQQIAAEAACAEYREDDVYALARRAWSYRELSRADFDATLTMLSDGFATRRGRRGALLHRDEVHRIVRGRRGTRMLALTSGGAIPEVADYRVLLEPEDTFIGTLNEDFAIESMAGDIFQLGNASWQVRQVVGGTVRVADAHGAPPTLPFWLGEAPARSDELSRAVSGLRADAEHILDGPAPDGPAEAGLHVHSQYVGAGFSQPDLVAWLETETGVCRGGAEQVAAYLEEGRRALGAIPTQDTLILERFFDEAGGMQLVLHAPFGSRINRAWALALRKRFCRQFNFELQAAATEDALLLSLGPQHSFPLADVFRYLHPATTREVLVQAFLDAPVFPTRWRWNTTISLAVPRNRNGKKMPPQLQRMQADDLMAAVFPEAAACLENIPGDREIPDHPLVSQTVRDCLEEAMDHPGLVRVLERIHRGELRLISRDTPEPSAFAHEILNARPYAFVDDAPLEERRTQAVQTRRAMEQSGNDIGALDGDAIERVRDEARPDPRDPDELHDALLTYGFLRPQEPIQAGEVGRAGGASGDMFEVLAAAKRATRITPLALPASPALPAPCTPPASLAPPAPLWLAAERLPELLAIHPDAAIEPRVTAPPARAARQWTRKSAVVEVLRSRLAMTGPVMVADLAASIAIAEADVDEALLALEAEGAVLRGRFTQAAPSLEWCDRRLLARIHRYTLTRLRAEISPVTPADFMRFLFTWQHVEPASRLTGPDGLLAVLAQLDGLELPARAWERDVLPSRVERYEPSALDMLCLTGQVAWARLSSGPTDVVSATPIAVFLREHADAWLALRRATGSTDATISVAQPFRAAPVRSAEALRHLGSDEQPQPVATSTAERLLQQLGTRGASFVHELQAAADLSASAVKDALGELVSRGLVTSDGFAGLRAIIAPASPSRAPSSPYSPSRSSARRATPADSGRWALLQVSEAIGRESAVETMAWALLRRYGVVFRRLLARETGDAAWRELVRAYRRLEARGEIRGGRFVTGMSGEQFALPDAVDRLREVRRAGPDDQLVTISGADPLNLTGIVTPGDRIRTSTGTRIVYRNGVPVAAMEGDMLRMLAQVEPTVAAHAAAAAAGRHVPVLSGYVGRHR